MQLDGQYKCQYISTLNEQSVHDDDVTPFEENHEADLVLRRGPTCINHPW